MMNFTPLYRLEAKTRLGAIVTLASADNLDAIADAVAAKIDLIEEDGFIDIFPEVYVMQSLRDGTWEELAEGEGPTALVEALEILYAI